jgi:phosphate transport system substrate-binding protein
MRKECIKGFLLAAIFAFAASSAVAADITGAGATFPYPIYAKWAEAYKQKSGIGMNYQSIGSGGVLPRSRRKPLISAPRTCR